MAEINLRVEDKTGNLLLEQVLTELGSVTITDTVSVVNPDGTTIGTTIGGNGVKSDITNDVWGRQKFINDFSLFHGLFTYDIPSTLWLMFENGIEVGTSTRITSVDGEARITSGAAIGNTAFLRSKRHPRYQPNRGHLFSDAGFFPNPTAIGIRQFGFKDTISGVYFQIQDGKLYAVILNKGLEKIKTEIDLSKIGLTISDLQFGHLYDIQFQWRGVGDYFFYIDQKLVYKTSFLGANTELTITNPAMSVGFFAENTNGTNVEIRIGCVDVTSEGGQREGMTYKSVTNSTEKAVNTLDYPVLCAKIKKTFNGVPNTRDTLALRVTGSSNQRSYMKCFITRDPTALTGASFTGIDSGSSVEFDVAATAVNVSKCKLLWSKRIEANNSAMVDLPSNYIDFYLTEGDYLILTANRDAPTQVANVILSLEMGEEI